MRIENKKSLMLRLLILVILLGGFLRLYELGTEDLAVDEAFYAKSAMADNFAEAIENCFSHDQHPVLVHLLFRVWGFLGNSEFILRSISAIFGVLSIIMIYLVVKAKINS